MPREDLAGYLTEMAQLIMAGDSLEGSIEYGIPDDLDAVLDDTTKVCGAYRMDDGTMRLLGCVDDSEPDDTPAAQLDAAHLREQLHRLSQWILEHRPQDIIEGGAVDTAIHIMTVLTAQEQQDDAAEAASDDWTGGCQSWPVEIHPLPNFVAHYDGAPHTRQVVSLMQIADRDHPGFHWYAAVMDETSGAIRPAHELPRFQCVLPADPSAE